MKAVAPVRYRKFGSIRIQSDDRVRFSPWTFPDLRYLNFAARGESITVERGGRTVMYLSAPRGRLGTACIAFDLPQEELLTLVSELRRAGHGLERWIVPALEYTQMTLHPVQHQLTHGRQLLESIPELLRSCRDLPVATTWQRTRRDLQRQWAEHLRSHPEDMAKVPAPWLLPVGYGSDGKPEKTNGRKTPKTRTNARPSKTTPQTAHPGTAQPKPLHPGRRT